MKYFIYLLSIILLLAVNLGLFGQFQLWNNVPNLLFLWLMFFCLDKDNYDFLFIAFFAGLFLDFYSAVFIGSFIFSFLLIGSWQRLLVNRIVAFEANWKLQLAMLVTSLQLLDLMVWLYNLLVSKAGWAALPLSLRAIENNFFPQLIYNLLLFYPMYVLYHFVKGQLTKWVNRKYRIAG